MATHFVSARLQGKARLRMRKDEAQHRDQYDRPQKPSPKAPQQRRDAQARHAARSAAFEAGLARGLTWAEAGEAAAEAQANSPARGKPDTMRKSYLRIQRQRRD